MICANKFCSRCPEESYILSIVTFYSKVTTVYQQENFDCLLIQVVQNNSLEFSTKRNLGIVLKKDVGEDIVKVPKWMLIVASCSLIEKST